MEKPKPPHRYEIQSDTFAAERIRGLKQGCREFLGENSEVISCLLFGSLSKGTSTPESDIDVAVFLDAEKIRGQDIKVSEEQEVDDEKGITRMVMSVPLEHTIADLYAFKLSNLVVYYTDPASYQGSHIHTYAISRSLIDEIVRRWESYLQASASKIFVLPPGSLYKMFHLQIAGDIEVYRAHFLSKLKERGEVGERMWQETAARLETWEQNIPVEEFPTPVHYPRTLDQAINKYGSEN
jgi:predicted nucleotidyltransferase